MPQARKLFRFYQHNQRFTSKLTKQQHRFEYEKFEKYPNIEIITKAVYIALGYFRPYQAIRHKMAAQDLEDCYQEASIAYHETHDLQAAIRAVRKYIYDNFFHRTKHTIPVLCSESEGWTNLTPLLTDLLVKLKNKKKRRGLTSSYRQASIICALADGMSLSKAADELGITYDNAKRHRQRAMTALTEYLNNQ